MALCQMPPGRQATRSTSSSPQSDASATSPDVRLVRPLFHSNGLLVPASPVPRCQLIIYDYVEPLLAKMAGKREAGYRSLGYRSIAAEELGRKQLMEDGEL